MRSRQHTIDVHFTLHGASSTRSIQDGSTGHHDAQKLNIPHGKDKTPPDPSRHMAAVDAVPVLKLDNKTSHRYGDLQLTYSTALYNSLNDGPSKSKISMDLFQTLKESGKGTHSTVLQSAHKSSPLPASTVSQTSIPKSVSASDSGLSSLDGLGGRQKRIAIAEDNPINAQILKVRVDPTRGFIVDETSQCKMFLFSRVSIFDFVFSQVVIGERKEGTSCN
jgi:hypothetical protein